MKDRQKYGAWAVITGGSSGIGRAIAEQLSKAGFKLVLVARKRDQLVKTADELSAECLVVSADLSTTEGRLTLLEATKNIDIGLFVHSAGIAHLGPFLTTPEKTDKDLLAIHCGATVELSRSFAERFQERGKGGIILVSSGLGYAPIPFAAVYAAAKSFVIGFGEAIAEELRPKDIDVLTVIPGATKTKMAEKLGQTIDMKKLPTPMGSAESVARAAIHALGRKDRIVPGLSNKIMAKAMKFLPTNMMKRQMAGMLQTAMHSNAMEENRNGEK